MLLRHTFTDIKLIFFTGQVSKYSSLLKSAQKNAFIRGGLTATTMGLFFGFIYGMYGLGLWYGVKVTSSLPLTFLMETANNDFYS